jgi:antitoxin (DNA-binding transcriptional repressor) of toxin-antitoxin stability system
MQTVNIRQRKTHPSTALAAARSDDTVRVMNWGHPQALLVGQARCVNRRLLDADGGC